MVGILGYLSRVSGNPSTMDLKSIIGQIPARHSQSLDLNMTPDLAMLMCRRAVEKGSMMEAE